MPQLNPNRRDFSRKKGAKSVWSCRSCRPRAYRRLEGCNCCRILCVLLRPSRIDAASAAKRVLPVTGRNRAIFVLFCRAAACRRAGSPRQSVGTATSAGPTKCCFLGVARERSETTRMKNHEKHNHPSSLDIGFEPPPVFQILPRILRVPQCFAGIPLHCFLAESFLYQSRSCRLGFRSPRSSGPSGESIIESRISD